jgi:PST family polysaccharide transporter
MSLFRKTISGAGWQTASVGVIAVLQIAVMAVLARYVRPWEFGIVAIAQMASSFLVMFSQMGLGPALVQRRDLNQDHMRVAFSLTIVLNLLLVAVLWMSAPLIALFFDAEAVVPVLRATSSIFLINGLGMVAESQLAREMRFRALAQVNVVSYALGFAVIGIGMAVAGYGVWALVGATIAQSVVHTTAVMLHSPHSMLPSFRKREMRDLLGFGGGLTLSQLFNNLALNGDNLIVGRWLGTEALGIYGRAYQLMVLPARYLGQSIDKVMFPALARIQDEPERISRTFLTANSVANLVLLPVSALMLVLAPEIVRVLLGSEWDAAIVPLQILVLAMSFKICVRLADSLVRAMGAVYQSAARKAVFAACIVAGSWLGQHWGLAGVATGVTAATGINYLLMVNLSLTLTSNSWAGFFRMIAPGFSVSLIMLTAVIPLTIYLRALAWPPLLVLVGVSVSAVATVALAFLIFPRLGGRLVNEFLSRGRNEFSKKKQASTAPIGVQR